MKKYYQINKSKWNIRTKTNQRLIKDKKCSECGSTENLQFHHVTYDIFNVITLCKKCHVKIHFGNKSKKIFFHIALDLETWNRFQEYKGNQTSSEALKRLLDEKDEQMK